MKHFKSIRNLVNASSYELQDVEKIGKIKAADIKRVVDEEYRDGICLAASGERQSCWECEETEGRLLRRCRPSTTKAKARSC